MAPSRFYSHSESDALAWLSKHILSPRGVKSQHVFSKEDDFFPGLQGRSDSSVSGGRSLEQPLFKQPAPLAALQQPGMRLGWGQEESTSASAAASHTTSVHEDDLGDDFPHLALADLGYQFSIWSHNRREIVTTTPFAVVRAPQQAHGAFNDTAALTLPQHSLGPSSASTHHSHPPTQDNASAADDTQDESARSSRRAAMIAKAMSNPTSSSRGILGSKSTSQKRAALQRNRHRKPTVDTPAPAPEAEKPKPTKQVMLRYDNTPEGYRTAVAVAIDEGLINANDDEVQALVKTFKESKNRKIKDNNDELDRHIIPGGAALSIIKEDTASERA